MKNYITDLSIEKRQGIEYIELHGLGRINVLCGKNNSGKTTIVSAITLINKQDDHIKYKISKITKENLEIILDHCSKYNEVARLVLLPDFDPLKKEWLQICDIFRLHFTTFIEDSDLDLIKEKKDNIIGDFISYLSEANIVIEIGARKEKFLVLIIDSILQTRKVHLIEAKRQFVDKTRASEVSKLEFSGKGFLESLFFIQNKLDGSSLKEKYVKLKEAFFRISGGNDFYLEFQRHEMEIELNFRQKKSATTWYKAKDSGLGSFELLLILYNVIFSEGDLIIIEEPENHLHPDVQRKLLAYLKSSTDAQFILTTHSNIFLDLTKVDKVYHVKYDQGIQVSDDTAKAAILQDLGYSISDNLLADIVILVEGPTDKLILEELLSKLGLDEKYNIKIWALGGDIMDKQDLSIFDSYNVIALLDQDPKSGKIRRRFERICEDYQFPVIRLERYSIENYFTLRALREVLGAQIDDSITNLDPNKKLEDQIGLDCKRNNRRIAKAMKIEEIENTDLFQLFVKIDEILRDNS